jgi:glycogen debranching enzyme
MDTEPLTRDDWRRLREESRRVFELNEVDEGGIYYHMPSFHHYSSLFAWDSGFHAVAMSHLDVRKAARELETLFRQVREDGHLPHEVLLPHRASHPRLRHLQTWLVRWEFDRRGASYMIDPPSYHYAAELVFRRSADREWLRRLWPGMCRCLDFLLEERDVLGNGLVTIFHPWESGTDMSPQFFSALKLDGPRWANLVKSDVYPTLLFARVTFPLASVIFCLP